MIKITVQLSNLKKEKSLKPRIDASDVNFIKALVRAGYIINYAGFDPMPDKMNLDYLKLLYCEFQKYEVMNFSVVGGHPKKKHANPNYKATKHIERTFLTSD